MHLVIGFLLASLLKSRKTGKQTLPIIRGRFEASHSIPGRIRFRVPVIETLRKTQINTFLSELSVIEGIDTAEISVYSGSILIQYDVEKIDPYVVCGILIKMLGLESELNSQPESTLQREINTISNALNHAVYHSTAGTLDLTSALYLLLVLFGIYKIVIQKDRSLPSGINLLWWAYVMAKGRKQ